MDVSRCLRRAGTRFSLPLILLPWKTPRPAQRLSRPDRELSDAARAFDFDLPCPRGGNRSAREIRPECLHVPENADNAARGASHKFLPAIEDKRDSETHTQGTGQGLFFERSGKHPEQNFREPHRGSF